MPDGKRRGFGPHRGLVCDDACRMVGTHRLGGMLLRSPGREPGTNLKVGRDVNNHTEM